MPFVNREERRIEWRFFIFILVCDDVWRKEGRKEGRKGLNWIAGNWRKWVVWWTSRQVVKGGKQGKRARGTGEMGLNSTTDRRKRKNIRFLPPSKFLRYERRCLLCSRVSLGTFFFL